MGILLLNYWCFQHQVSMRIIIGSRRRLFRSSNFFGVSFEWSKRVQIKVVFGSLGKFQCELYQFSVFWIAKTTILRLFLMDNLPMISTHSHPEALKPWSILQRASRILLLPTQLLPSISVYKAKGATNVCDKSFS